MLMTLQLLLLVSGSAYAFEVPCVDGYSDVGGKMGPNSVAGEPGYTSVSIRDWGLFSPKASDTFRFNIRTNDPNFTGPTYMGDAAFSGPHIDATVSIKHRIPDPYSGYGDGYDPDNSNAGNILVKGIAPDGYANGWSSWANFDVAQEVPATSFMGWENGSGLYVDVYCFGESGSVSVSISQDGAEEKRFSQDVKDSSREGASAEGLGCALGGMVLGALAFLAPPAGAAAAVGAGSITAGVGAFTFSCAITGAALGLIGYDPEDADYTTLVTLSVPSVPAWASTGNPALDGASVQMFVSTVAAAANLDAMMRSIYKAQGARAAGDKAWGVTQMNASHDFAREAALALDDAVSTTKTFFAVVEQVGGISDFDSLVVSSAEASTFSLDSLPVPWGAFHPLMQRRPRVFSATRRSSSPRLRVHRTRESNRSTSPRCSLLVTWRH